MLMACKYKNKFAYKANGEKKHIKFHHPPTPPAFNVDDGGRICLSFT